MAHDQAALRRIYAEVDSVLEGWTCPSSTDCCRFGITGRQPYLWPNEWALVERALRARGAPTLKRRGGLPIVDDEHTCPLLDGSGRCTVYDARPFGCRTYFCERAEGPDRKPPRDRLAELARRVAALAEQEDPRAGGPRPLSRWLDSSDKKR